MGAPSLASSATSSSTNATATATTTTTTTTRRLRREDFRRTKHDSTFSKWKVLIGPWDWENHSAGKEGAERYRVANLPVVSGPGLYEIGVAVWRTDSGRDVAKLEPDRIVVVYLGQAENVRSRLQHYGRSGSHLVQCHDQRTALFNDIFSRGYPIVYRWALMESKSEAEKTEAELLEKFDYAWNKAGNGARRPNDVIRKIEAIASRNNNIPKILKMLKSLGEKKVGIPIKANKPSQDTSEESVNFFDRVLKFGRSQPRVVSANPHKIIEQYNQICICGVDLSDGSICSKQPVDGRKRCAEHKGRRLTSRTTKSLFLTHSQEYVQEKPPTGNAKKVVNDDFSRTICGVIIPQLDGSMTACAQPPFPGRKRCLEHRGMRVNQIIPSSPTSLSMLGVNGYCGVDLGDGKCCMAQPVKGRKRCEKHKGMRAAGYIPLLSTPHGQELM